eukprot:jgi/Undpi1/5748/HiC_scaffold_2.g01022.m1
MTDRKIFDLFYGAREGDYGMCRRAYEAGADINFAFDGRRATKGGAGRWYYGDLQWYAPDGINGDKMDTLLIIAVKTNNEELTSLILGLDGVDATKKNGKGLDAMTVAKALGREHLLLEMATSKSDTAMATSASDKVGPRAIHEVEAGAAAADGGDGGSAAMSLDALVPPPPGTFAGGEAGLEVVQLGYAVEMLKASNNEKEIQISKAEKECQAYQDMLKEKDANIGELRKSVLEKEKEVIAMMHKIGRLEEALSQFTDDRQADAEQYSAWGQAEPNNTEGGATVPPDGGGSGSEPLR